MNQNKERLLLKIMRSALLVCLFMMTASGLVFGGEQKGKSGKKVITIFIAESIPQPAADNKLFKLIEKEFGVTFQFEMGAGDVQQKLGVMIAGEDYPDLISGDVKLIDAGALIPLEDLIEKNCPNLKKHYGPYWNRVKEPKDGHFYMMPDYGRCYGKYSTPIYLASGMWIQKGVLKEFGYPKVKTLDEYFDLIEKYKNKYPTIDGKPTIGFDILTYQDRNWCLRNPPQFLTGHPNDGDVLVDQKTFAAKIFADTDIAKRYYRKLNEANQKGLINKESFVQSYDQYKANIASGRVLAFHDQKWQFGDGEKPLVLDGKTERTYVALPITYDGKTRDWYRDRPPLNLHNGFGISKKCKDPVAVLKLFDALLDEKWQKILQWGIEGEDYLVDSKGRFYRTPAMRKQWIDPVYEVKNRALALSGRSPKMEGTYSDGNACTPGDQPEEYFAGLNDYDKEFLKAYNLKMAVDFLSEPPENPKYYPCWQIDLIVGSDAQIANQKMKDWGMKYLPRIILAEPARFEKLWQEYVDGFKAINVKAYEDRINDQIQWRLKNW